jgi:hypothetical protein
MQDIDREPIELTESELDAVVGGLFDANGVGGEVEVSGVIVQANTFGTNNAFNG